MGTLCISVTDKSSQNPPPGFTEVVQLLHPQLHISAFASPVNGRPVIMKTMLPLLLLLALLAGHAVAQSASRDSAYKGAKGSGKGFKDAKVGLLDEYAKLKKTSWKLVSEKLSDDAYTITYAFPSAAILADFQKWQYDQPSFKKLEAYSQKQKGLGASTPAGHRKLVF